VGLQTDTVTVLFVPSRKLRSQIENKLQTTNFINSIVIAPNPLLSNHRQVVRVLN
jgi:hypothetical protein